MTRTDMMRYLSYGWGNSIIGSLVRRRFGARILSRCIDNLRKGLPCTPRCRENCVFQRFE